MKTFVECPICGAEMHHKYYNSKIYCGSVGVNVKLTGYECHECGCEVGNNRENNKIVKQAREDAATKCAVSIIKNFKNKKENLSEIERIYSLPVRTLSKWMNNEKKPSAAAVTLLRIISAFPWMTKAVDSGLESETANNIARQYYYTEFNTYDKQIVFTTDKQAYYVAAKINKPSVNNYGNLGSVINENLIIQENNTYAIR